VDKKIFTKHQATLKMLGFQFPYSKLDFGTNYDLGQNVVSIGWYLTMSPELRRQHFKPFKEM